ncbi:DEAD/DEAH box helicase [Novosphingobium beihaiensis]|uniref:DEAD/DEAH box helicase family protein n=1 Tax=Novosphingobium beihaiensis TaxID=2930389 RepID=A0ABT0BN38_9SPHN|nr:DEAD/DEAH box helicase family protein [Novosphingobium beihaiensis]MCJ2186467.1 DEAD/DEAH box helicase family protein [Novosphingobium beihaiensis]
MELKTYQKAALGTLRDYLAEARVTGPVEAYRTVTSQPEIQQRLGAYLTPYRPLKELTDAPYVCLRLPTGGGKTILAAHSIDAAREAWIEKDYPLVLWLVPTTTIRKQTVEALKNPRHPYRKVLDNAFGGKVRVVDIGDFAQLTPHDLTANCCVIVGTIQTLRVSNTEGRKVYAHNEALEPHFAAIPKKAPGLEKIEDDKKGAGTIRYSFANLLHLHRPLMIVDEAHQAVTGLSQEMQRRVNPTAIIEFTATPRLQSNLLHSVTAQELKNEDMIKLPVMLAEHPTWQQAVDGAILKRQELQDIAETDARYIRPIVLFQAQNKNQTANVDTLKQYLLDEGITENRIAIATGDQRELDDVNLFDPACEVDFVITVEALKEGWDCSFAYVFCSLANIENATDAEQLLGRVLRMPYAKARKDPRLNKAYAHLASPSFSAAAMALRDKMVAMGFDETEATQNIQPQQGDLDTGLFGPQARPKPSITVNVDLSEEDEALLRDVAPEKVQVSTTDQGKVIRVVGFLTPDEKAKVRAAIPGAVANKVKEALDTYEAENAARMSPAAKGLTFTVPALMVHVQGELELAETDLLMEHCNWSLLSHSAQLDGSAFDVKQTANTFEIDLDGRKVTVSSRDPETQISFDVDVEGWTETGLVLFLAKQVREADLSPTELIEWLTKAVSHLTGARDLPLPGLMQCKYVLARKLKERVAEIRKKERGDLYQASLFGSEAQPEISFENGFTFKDGMFGGVKLYHGGYEFQKHFFGPDHIPAFDGKPGGDEEQCAKELDNLPADILKHWVRNVSQHQDALWLPLAENRFYPDFVAELTDGRLLLIEYKGGHIVTSDDTKNKVAVGRLWEQTMNGKGLFLLVEKLVDGKPPREQILAKIKGS